MPEISKKAIDWIASQGIEYRDNDYVWVCQNCGNILKSIPTKECIYCNKALYEKVYKYYDLISPEMYEDDYNLVNCKFCGRGSVSQEYIWACSECKYIYDNLDEFDTSELE